jgi:hypothetical protein
MLRHRKKVKKNTDDIKAIGRRMAEDISKARTKVQRKSGTFAP